MEHKIEHNEQNTCFETFVEGNRCVVDYYMSPFGYMVITHTEVPYEVGGRGIAASLTKAALEYAKQESLKVQPLCPYTAAYMERNPEYKELLPDKNE